MYKWRCSQPLPPPQQYALPLSASPQMCCRLVMLVGLRCGNSGGQLTVPCSAPAVEVPGSGRPHADSPVATCVKRTSPATGAGLAMQSAVAHVRKGTCGTFGADELVGARANHSAQHRQQARLEILPHHLPSFTWQRKYSICPASCGVGKIT